MKRGPIGPSTDEWHRRWGVYNACERDESRQNPQPRNQRYARLLDIRTTSVIRIKHHTPLVF